MQSFSRVLIPYGVFALALSACSGGGLSLPPAAQCPTDYAVALPVNMIPPPQQKISTGPGQLQPGTYTYVNGTVSLKEAHPPNPATPIVLQDQDQAVLGVSTTQVGLCMLNARPATTGLTAQTDGVTDIIVHKDLTQTVQTRHFSAGIMNTVNQITVSPKSTATYPSVSAALTAATAADTPQIQSTVFVQNTISDFEIRTQMSPNFYLSVHMLYTSCPPLPVGCP